MATRSSRHVSSLEDNGAGNCVSEDAAAALCGFLISNWIFAMDMLRIQNIHLQTHICACKNLIKNAESDGMLASA